MDSGGTIGLLGKIVIVKENEGLIILRHFPRIQLTISMCQRKIKLEGQAAENTWRFSSAQKALHIVVLTVAVASHSANNTGHVLQTTNNNNTDTAADISMVYGERRGRSKCMNPFPFDGARLGEESA